MWSGCHLRPETEDVGVCEVRGSRAVVRFPPQVPQNRAPRSCQTASQVRQVCVDLPRILGIVSVGTTPPSAVRLDRIVRAPHRVGLLSHRP
jgi:hypothetical protein